jgi:hypothetical protein
VNQPVSRSGKSPINYQPFERFTRHLSLVTSAVLDVTIQPFNHSTIHAAKAINGGAIC